MLVSEVTGGSPGATATTARCGGGQLREEYRCFSVRRGHLIKGRFSLAHQKVRLICFEWHQQRDDPDETEAAGPSPSQPGVLSTAPSPYGWHSPLRILRPGWHRSTCATLHFTGCYTFQTEYVWAVTGVRRRFGGVPAASARWKGSLDGSMEPRGTREEAHHPIVRQRLCSGNRLSMGETKLRRLMW